MVLSDFLRSHFGWMKSYNQKTFFVHFFFIKGSLGKKVTANEYQFMVIYRFFSFELYSFRKMQLIQYSKRIVRIYSDENWHNLTHNNLAPNNIRMKMTKSQLVLFVPVDMKLALLSTKFRIFLFITNFTEMYPLSSVL